MKKIPLYVCKHTSFRAPSGELHKLEKILEEHYKDTVFFQSKPHCIKGVLYREFNIVYFVVRTYQTESNEKEEEPMYEFNRLRGCVVTSTQFYRELLDRLFPGRYSPNHLLSTIAQFVSVQPKTEITNECFKHLWFMLISDVQECVQSALCVLANYAYAEHELERGLIFKECLFRCGEREYETATMASEIMMKFVTEYEECKYFVHRDGILPALLEKLVAPTIWTGRLRVNLVRLCEEFL
jgi:hypothetical protein